MPKTKFKIVPLIICTLAALFYVYDYFIQVTPSVLTHELMHDLAINAAGLSIIASCFYYSYTLMQIPAGFLIDRFGARISLTFAVIISACGVLLFGSANSLLIAGLGRFCIGLGSAFAFVGTLFLASRWFSHKRFAFVAGLTQMGGALGSIIGLAPIAILVHHYNWHQIMLVTGALTLASAVIYWLVIRDGREDTQETTQRVSLKNLHLKRIPNKAQVIYIALCGLTSWVPAAGFGALWGTIYLAQSYQISVTSAGRICSLFWIGLAIGSPLLGWLSNYLKCRCAPMQWAFISGLIASIAILYAFKLPLWCSEIALFMLGFSSSVQSLSFGALKDNIPNNIFGTLSGLNNMAAILGGALAQVTVGIILSHLWDGTLVHSTPFYTVHAYRLAFLILPTAALLGFLLSKFLVKETHCQTFKA